jgi:ketosteroid isomerase-like protein
MFRTGSEDIADQKAADRRRQRELEAALSASRESLRAMTELLDQARTNQSITTQQVAALAEQVDGAAQTVAQAERREREAAAETQRARKLAEAYSARIESTGREKARDQALARARADARPAAPTIAPEEVRRAGSTLQQWKAAWERKDIARHLTFYLSDAVGERISVRDGRETRTRLSHAQLFDAIRASDPTGWEGVAKSSTRAEGSNVVAEIPYRRRDGSSALYDFWVRKAFWDRRGSDWRIVREEWRYYDAVPQFSDR